MNFKSRALGKTLYITINYELAWFIPNKCFNNVAYIITLDNNKCGILY